jgi:vacuolar protein sorting-associated protein IST1
MVEATSTIIHAAPYIYSKGLSLQSLRGFLLTASLDLDPIRNILFYRLGPDFARSATGNRNHHVSSRVLKCILTPVPSASQLDAYLRHIADGYGVTWTPEPSRQDLFVFHFYILPLLMIL